MQGALEAARLHYVQQQERTSSSDPPSFQAGVPDTLASSPSRLENSQKQLEQLQMEHYSLRATVNGKDAELKRLSR